MNQSAITLSNREVETAYLGKKGTRSVPGEGPLILSVETATFGGGVCLMRGTEVLSTRVGDPHVSHSNRLLQEIADSLEKAHASMSDVDLFAAAVGPGSFTGLRIGLATIKALAVTLGRPCLGIHTLHILARSAGASAATVAVLPAGRGEVFVQLFAVSQEDTVTEIDRPAHLSPATMITKYGGLPVLRWCGEGSQIHRELIRNHARERGIEFQEDAVVHEARPQLGWILAAQVMNLSTHLGALALKEFERGEAVVPANLTALYVRPSDAELKCP